jgi:malate synthase
MNGNGCVPIYNLMEDAATAEISRAQLWQWARHGARTKEGGTVSGASVNAAIAGELEKMKREFGEAAFQAGRFEAAGRLFGEMVTGEEFAEFLTLDAYNYID